MKSMLSTQIAMIEVGARNILRGVAQVAAGFAHVAAPARRGRILRAEAQEARGRRLR